MARKKLSKGWIRETSDENSNVFRWYEKGNTTASLVQGDHENEAEWRISGNFGSLESRGGKNLMLKKSDAQNIRIIETLIRREKFM